MVHANRSFSWWCGCMLFLPILLGAQRECAWTGSLRFWVVDIERDAVCCWVAAWADSPQAAWTLMHDVRTELLRGLRREGVALSLKRHTHEWSGAGAAGPPAPFPAAEPAPASPAHPAAHPAAPSTG